VQFAINWVPTVKIIFLNDHLKANDQVNDALYLSIIDNMFVLGIILLGFQFTDKMCDILFYLL